MKTLADPDPWTNVAAGYAGWVHGQLSRYAQDAVRVLQPSPTSTVLDVACGTGAATLAFARVASHVTGVDFSAGMLDRLRASPAVAASDNLTLLEGDGQRLDLPDDHVDFGVSMFGLMFFRDRAAGFAELRRCVRPGGRVAVSCWPPAADSAAMRWMVDGFAHAFPENPPPPESDAALDSADKLREELDAAGFVEVEVHQLSHDVVVDDVAEFWREMLAGNVRAGMARPNFSDDEWARRHDAAIAYLQRNATLPLRLPMPAILGIGTKRSV